MVVKVRVVPACLCVVCLQRAKGGAGMGQLLEVRAGPQGGQPQHHDMARRRRIGHDLIPHCCQTGGDRVC